MLSVLGCLLTRQQFLVHILLPDLSLRVVLLGPKEAVGLEGLYVLQFFIELLLHLVGYFDLVLVLNECQCDPFELVLGYYLRLVDLAAQQLRRLVSAH